MKDREVLDDLIASEGVSKSETGFEFDWTADDPETDIILLCKDEDHRGEIEGVEYVWGYTYNPKVQAEHPEWIKEFRTALKGDIYTSPYFDTDAIDDFVEIAVCNLLEAIRFDEIKGIVSPEYRIGSLLDHVEGYILEYRVRAIEVSLHLLKSVTRNVRFDEERAIAACVASGIPEQIIRKRIRKAYDTLQRERESVFKMKKYMPRELREGFSEFLIFAKEEDRAAYNSLQGVAVLVIDDFATSGATLKEMLRLLKTIHDKNRLVAFALIKQ